MGIFSKILIDKHCPNCKREIREWQSKGMWLKYKKHNFFIAEGDSLELDKNMSGEMHTSCEKHFGGCGKWIECKIEKGRVIETIVKETYDG